MSALMTSAFVVNLFCFSTNRNKNPPIGSRDLLAAN